MKAVNPRCEPSGVPYASIMRAISEDYRGPDLLDKL